MFENKITIITGYYGSGKSEFCLNYALELRKETDESISIVDLDVINPYFRTRSMKDFLLKFNVEILGSILEDTPMADIPQISPNSLKPIHSKTYGIYDLGGDMNGLRVLKSMYNHLMQVNYNFYIVLNIFREETDSVSKIVDYIHLINESTVFQISGMINNTNLLMETTVEDYMQGHQILNEVSHQLGIPIVGGLVNEYMDVDVLKQIEYPLLVTSRYLKPYE